MLTKIRFAPLLAAFAMAAALLPAPSEAEAAPKKKTTASQKAAKAGAHKASGKKARHKTGKKSGKKSGHKAAASSYSDRTNTIAGFPVEVSSIVMVLEGPDKFRILSEDLPHARRTPASVTKLMTLAVLFDELEAKRVHLEDMIEMPSGDPGGGKLGLPAGYKISVKNAILAMVTKSANDAALAIAEHIGGSEAKFAEMMNKKAAAIGMANSHFVNAHGMRDARQYSTAYDLAMLSRHLLQDHSEHYHYFSTLSFIFGKQTYGNHNQLMRQYEGMDGLKTGMTFHGWQLAASAERTKQADPESDEPAVKHRLIGVFLGGITKAQRNNCLGYLLDQGYAALGHDLPPSKFRYSTMACTSARNASPAPAPAPAPAAAKP
ncbi:MAG TPA: D-alanyl-D-alanine carboxypeptidase family protein [Micavibrio sp.]